MDKEYRSTALAFQDFLTSTVWIDIVYELTRWIEDLRRELESPDRTDDIGLVRQLQGNIEAVRKVLQMPLEIAENIIIDNKMKEE